MKILLSAKDSGATPGQFRPEDRTTAFAWFLMACGIDSMVAVAAVHRQNG
jgi:hypothetical protein